MPLAIPKLKCPEEGCKGVLVRREGVHGVFFGCTEWRNTKCPGSVQADEHGRPVGPPAPSDVKRMREEAHDVFDRLWKDIPGGLDRRNARFRAYAWLAWVLGRYSLKHVHIGEFDAVTCQRVIDYASVTTWRDLIPNGWTEDEYIAHVQHDALRHDRRRRRESVVAMRRRPVDEAPPVTRVFCSPDLTLDETTHTYYRGGARLYGVTSLIDRIVPPFDAPTVAARMAKRDGGKAQDLLDAWARKRDEAADAGKHFHEAAEAILSGRVTLTGDARHDGFFNFWSRLQDKGLRVASIEQVLDHPEYPLAGTADAVLLGIHQLLWVGDWKTNEKYTYSGGWSRLLPPFDDLMDNKLTLHSLQVSTYRVLLEARGHTTAGAFIAHVDRDGKVQPVLAHDFRERIRAWLPSVNWGN